MPLEVEQDIIRLDITMNDIVAMQMMEPGCCLSTKKLVLAMKKKKR